MKFYCPLYIILLIYACCKLPQSISHSEDSTEGSYNIQDLSKSNPQSIGILPIGEIIRKANLPQLMYSTSTEKPKKNKSQQSITPKINIIRRKSKISTVKILLKGTESDISSIPYKKIIKNLKYINRINLSLPKKYLVWNIIKREKSVSDMNREYLENLCGLLYDIPENEYISFNTSDWNIVDFFGTSKQLTRRRAAIIGYAMKHHHGDHIIQDLTFINKLKGLICGFSQSDLQNLSPSLFQDIHQSVFDNLWPCTREQMSILLNIAQKSEVYGPFELWDEKLLRKIGLLITVIKVEDFGRFSIKAFSGLEPYTLDVISDDQKQWFNEKRVEYQNMMLYGLIPKSGSKMATISLLLLLQSIYLILNNGVLLEVGTL